MYVRTIQRRNKDGSVVRYLQLAHNVREPGKQPVARVIHSFGREDQLDRGALARLVRSISRFLEPGEALRATAAEELRFLGSRPFGGAFALDALWRRLGIGEALGRVARRRRVTALVERLLFCLVLALLLIRVAETKTGDTWPNLRRELQRLHLGEFHGSAGRVLQRTETTPRQREILNALDIHQPPRFLAIEPTVAAATHA